MMIQQPIPSGRAMLQSMLIGFLLGFVLMGAARGSFPAVPSMEEAAQD